MSLYFQFMLSYCALINFLYAGFNLLPIYPYDGGRILRSILWMRKKEYKNATIKSIYVGYYTGIVVVALGFYFLIEKFFPFYNLGIIIIGFYFISVSRTYIKQINEFNSTKT
ncbi:site-2 protease family protein [Candidatus Lokiarchaeum ossiferum]|uniref:site-2 protease family protein n=1 Tax=Candidatus Lokiarchaeum ossiferum TaxID=2951803 RepID=UPI00352F5A9F